MNGSHRSYGSKAAAAGRRSQLMRAGDDHDRDVGTERGAVHDRLGDQAADEGQGEQAPSGRA